MARLTLSQMTPIAQSRIIREKERGRIAQALAEKTVEHTKSPILIPRGSTDPLWLAQLKQRIKSISTP